MSFLEIGKIVKAQGLKGSMKVVSYLENVNVLQSVKEVLIDRGGKDALPFAVKQISIKNKIFFLDLEGIGDADATRDLIGSVVLIPSHNLEKLPEDEYYWHDLVGLDVVTESGEKLGSIETVFSTGSNDVYVCTGGDREILLPAIADVIKKIDMQNRVMVIRLLEGL